MKTPSIILASILLLGGCSATTPPLREYTILPNGTGAMESKPTTPATLALASTKSIPSLASKALRYVRSDGETGSYLYAKWNDTPAVLIARIITSQLHTMRVFETILPAVSTAQADWILESDLQAFDHRFDPNGGNKGVIEITYRLVDARTRHSVASRRFVIAADSPSPDAAGGVDALNRATHQLADQCTGWITTVIQEKK